MLTFKLIFYIFSIKFIHLNFVEAASLKPKEVLFTQRVTHLDESFPGRFLQVCKQFCKLHWK